ncbi:hypothetical protein HELRODRAFT_168030 [Helobdella robusta]|uniref:Uncharacterized protein n=1 Tax=Helobdella robusta TaxID=6412 RepID=T1F029_HELRO|nr:hypothetical protein HELRODRAFT_168030 [Helobdella robusta]ESO10161.1 hypothetical protein HELRODRAFT_168030 [Helobdella robusta]
MSTPAQEPQKRKRLNSFAQAIYRLARCSLLDFHLTWNLDSSSTTDNKRIDYLERRTINNSSSSDYENIEYENYIVKTGTNSPLTLHINERKCLSLLLFLKDKIRDKLNPISIFLDYNLADSQLQKNGTYPDAILNIFAPSVYILVPIQNNCGADMICIPDLKLNVSSISDHFILGSLEELEIVINIFNDGEDAHESVLFLELPPGASYVNIKHINEKSLDVSCCLVSNNNIQLITCDVGNPLLQNDSVSFVVRISSYNVNFQTRELIFKLFVNSSNNEMPTPSFSNEYELLIKAKSVIDVEIRGVSLPQQIFCNDTRMTSEIDKESFEGSLVTHLYEIINLGPGHIDKLFVSVNWSGESSKVMFLFLNDSSVLPGKVFCKICDGAREKCEIICVIHNLTNKESVLIRIEAKIYINLNEQDYFDQYSAFSSEARVLKLQVPYNVTPVFKSKLFKITTKVFMPITSYIRREFWKFVIGILVGCSLLTIAMLILYEKGFFKRKKIDDEDYEDIRPHKTYKEIKTADVDYY